METVKQDAGAGSITTTTIRADNSFQVSHERSEIHSQITDPLSKVRPRRSTTNY
jgi:hypothetical protein